KNFCVVDAAMNDMARPAMYQAWMDVKPVVQSTDAAVRYDVVGPVCESSDVLGTDRTLAILAGDFLAILATGAYGMTMASNYNSRARPPEVLIDRGKVIEVRTRETVASLFSLERRLPEGSAGG
ncbi:MAG: diaminopimelate decarboxylase family protein, partial [Usitatibacter sp.]